MRTTTQFQKFIQRIIERATDPSPDRYLDHVRVRNFGRPQTTEPKPNTAYSFGTNNGPEGEVSSADGMVWGK
ncbi:MAG: hypothetical protein KC931_18015 [Candidatus Omnitrophica bacterium]|nr:hypothetical protein [Candidatus Omnitrophota bacterium]